MEVLTNIIQQYESINVYYVLFGLMLITSLGMFPGNTDVFMMGIGVLTTSSLLETNKAIAMCLSALFLGETIAFLLGNRFGKKILNHSFFTKEKYQKRATAIESYLNKGKLPTILALRFVPILRPVNIAMVGTFSKQTKSFYSMHIVLLGLYVPTNILLSRLFSHSVQGILT